MAKADLFKGISWTKLILFTIWLISFLVITFCTVVIMAYPGQIPLKHKILLFVPVQIASGFFFPISIGKIIQLVRERDIATVLWNFISDCSEAGLSRFYASREKTAKIDLEKRFNGHRKGDILITGPSLRLFLSPGAHFHAVIDDNIKRYDKLGVNIRIVHADIGKNISIPIRAFVEEFNPDGQHPRGEHRTLFDWESSTFDWHCSIHDCKDLNLAKFYEDFYKKYGSIPSVYKSRCIRDLENVAGGICELNAKTESGDLIRARKSMCAPYFTAVIFPDICYYTPNMLNPKVPVNMPMLAFLAGGPVYEKILTHFKFLWWSGESYEDLRKPIE